MPENTVYLQINTYLDLQNSVQNAFLEDIRENKIFWLHVLLQ